MKDFDTAANVENIVWQMRLADWPRADNRDRINRLFNGEPPFEQNYVEQNKAAVNVNSLEGTKIMHDARAQYANAFMVPDPLFNVACDYGPPHKHREYGDKITKRLNRIIKHSRDYFELQRSVFANSALHGIGPSVYDNRFDWCHDATGVEDVLVPANTYCTLRNLPMFAIYRQYTGMQMRKMTSGPKVDPGWNLPLVNQMIKWVDEETTKLMGTSWPEVWSPEKMSERVKGDGGLYASDAVPTIDCYDFYFWNDDKKVAGWNRRVVLDAWGSPGAGGVPVAAAQRRFDYGENEFLFNPKSRIYASKLSEIVHFQFANCSAVAPFRYHSVRSLGFLLWAVCHLQNRLRCKFSDAVFESLMQYFRANNAEDAERLEKVDLIDKGLIPPGLEFVPPNQRWQVNEGLAQQAMLLNRQTMADNSSSFVQETGFTQKMKGEPKETATAIQQRANASASLIGSMLDQAYTYETFRYQEMARRFCIKNSRNADVRKFRNDILRDDVPEEALDHERWHITPNKAIGGGNKMLQVAMADKLMALRPMLDPDSQKRVDRIYISANADDYELAEILVPESPVISDSVHDAQLAAGTLMEGLPVALKTGINHGEYAESLLAYMGMIVQRIKQTGGMATPKELVGLQTMAQHIAQHIAVLAQNPQEKQHVKKLGDVMGKLLNEIRAFAQRLMEARQKAMQNQGNGQQMDPKDAAKIQAMMLQAKVKSDNAKQSHAQRTVQRQIQFEQQMQQDAQKHSLELKKLGLEHRSALRNDLLETAANVQQSRMQALNQPDENSD